MYNIEETKVTPDIREVIHANGEAPTILLL